MVTIRKPDNRFSFMEQHQSVPASEAQPYWLADERELTSLWPLGIQRCFYIYGVGEETERGKHRHRQCHMALSCPQGSVTIYCQTPDNEFTYQLDNKYPWLVLPAGVWRMMYAFSSDALLFVLASEPFDAQDYIESPYRPLML